MRDSSVALWHPLTGRARERSRDAMARFAVTSSPSGRASSPLARAARPLSMPFHWHAFRSLPCPPNFTLSRHVRHSPQSNSRRGVPPAPARATADSDSATRTLTPSSPPLLATPKASTTNGGGCAFSAVSLLRTSLSPAWCARRAVAAGVRETARASLPGELLGVSSAGELDGSMVRRDVATACLSLAFFLRLVSDGGGRLAGGLLAPTLGMSSSTPRNKSSSEPPPSELPLSLPNAPPSAMPPSLGVL